MSPKKPQTQRDWNYPRARDTQTNVRLKADDKELLVRLADHFDLSIADVVVQLVRQEAKRQGLPVRGATLR